MSHFTVLVIGDEIEAQLDPFYEGLEVEAYKDYLSEETIENIKKYYCGVRSKEVDEETWTKMRAGYIERDPDWETNLIPEDQWHTKINEWVGGGETGEDENGWYTLSTYNKDSKWDWYQIGGRWSGELLLKPGAEGLTGEKSWALGDGDPYHQDGRVWADQAYKGDIDWEEMRRLRRVAALETWEEYLKASKAFRENDPESMDVKKMEAKWWVEKYPDENTRRIEVAKSISQRYGAKEAMSRAEYIEENSKFSAYAMLNDGEWIESGRMGWWGMTLEVKHDAYSWPKVIEDTLAAVSDDTMISIVDCHI